MSVSTIYTLGYQDKDLRDIADFINAGRTLVDIRYSPYSQRKEFHRDYLSSLFGQRYMLVQDWGNVNYANGAEIRIKDFDEGWRRVARIPGAVVLMCVCSDLISCHRRIIGQRVRNEYGYRPHELTRLEFRAMYGKRERSEI